MKKWLPIAATVIALLAALLPTLSGAIARNRIEAELARVSESLIPLATVRIETGEWRSSWLSSEADLHLDVASGQALPPAFEMQPFSATLPGAIKVRHGPVLTGDASGIGWANVAFEIVPSAAPALARAMLDPADEQIIGAAMTLHFLGSTRYRLRIAALDLSRAGLTDTPVLAGPATMALHLRGGELGKTPLHSLSGESSFALARLEADPLHMHGLHVDARSRKDGEDIVASNETQLDSLRIGDRELRDLRIDWSSRVNAEAIARYLEFIASQADAEVPPTMEHLAQELMPLLGARARYGIDHLSLTYQGMPASAKLAAEYRGDLLPAERFEALAEMPAGPDAIVRTAIDALSATLDLSVHAGILALPETRPLAAFVGGFVEKGYIREEGEHLVLSMELRDGAVVAANGETLYRFPPVTPP